MQNLVDSFNALALPSRPSPPRSISPYDSEDEVVLCISGSGLSFSAKDSESGTYSQNNDDDNDEDFVLLDRPHPTGAIRRRSDAAADSDLSDNQGECLGNSVATKPSITETTVIYRGRGDANVTSVALSKPIDPVTPVFVSQVFEGRGVLPFTTVKAPVAASAREAKDKKHDSERAAFKKARKELKKLHKKEAIASGAATPEDRERERRERREAKKELKKLQKKEARVANASGAPAAATTPEDKERERRERKRAARRRHHEHRRLRKEQQADPAANKSAPSTPTKAKIVAQTTPLEIYQEASSFISSFLETPTAKRDSVCRLTLLQSLMVELGFISTPLPTSLRAARTFVKAHVFLNIKDYIAHRGNEQAVIQRLLHPSRGALVKDIRRKGNIASRKWVKQHGLEVLLVECFHH